MSDDLAGLAAMTFAPWSAGIVGDVPTRTAFLKLASSAHQALAIGVGVMTKTPEELTDGMRRLQETEGEDALVKVLDEAAEVSDWLTGLSDIMQGVLTRLMVAAARVSESTT